MALSPFSIFIFLSQSYILLIIYQAIIYYLKQKSQLLSMINDELQRLNYNINFVKQMKNAEIINEFIKSQSYKHLMASKQIEEHNIKDIIKEYFPKIGIVDKLNLSIFMNDEELFDKMQRIFQAHQEIYSRIQSIEQQINLKSRSNNDDSIGIGTGKKVTRAALARRHEKNQQQIRKDQIFVRLAPKSQSCIQFMLSNRNFPRLQCKLSCNQHLEYLVNYLTNKWIRGKVGYKIVLYPDNSFLKSMPLPQKQKALKEPLNNYLMFTDIMACCGIHQNGILDLCYEIVQIKKMIKPNADNNAQNMSVEASHSQPIQTPKVASIPLKEKIKASLGIPEFNSSFNEKVMKNQPKNEPIQTKITTPNKLNFNKDQASNFNRNSNFFNEQSMFGSLGFNFNFGPTPNKRDDHLLSINSINYDSHFLQAKKQNELKQNSPNKEDSSKQVYKETPLKQEQMFTKNNKLQEANEQVSQKSNFIYKQLKKENSQQKFNIDNKAIKDQVAQDTKLGTLMSFLQQIQKQKPSLPSLHIPVSQDQAQNNNSNKVKDVKLVSIVKRRNNS